MNQDQFRYRTYQTNLYVKNELHRKEVRMVSLIRPDMANPNPFSGGG